MIAFDGLESLAAALADDVVRIRAILSAEPAPADAPPRS
jgi:hypothetical protein